jgi:YD repeat-containing protein
VRKRVYASISVITAALSMSGCFGECNLVESHDYLTFGPNPAEVGEQVTFTTGMRMNKGFPNGVEWDLDGNGSLETSTGATPVFPPSRDFFAATARRSYASPASIPIRYVIRAISGDITEYAVGRTVILEVRGGQNQPPLASFTVNPNPVAPEGQVTYDASESSDPDGQVVRYEWDLDGNGTYELDTGSSPTTTQMESTNGFGPYPKEYTAGLRVTDGGGATATTTREVIVDHPTPRLASPSKLAQRLAASKSFEFPPRLREVDPGELMLNGEELIIQGRVDRGRLPASAFPASLRRGKRKVRWVSSTDAVIDSASESGTGRGLALLRFPAGGRACMAFRVDSPPSGKAAGSFRILGGVARATGLRGRGMGEGRMTKDGIAVSGRIDLDFGGKRNFRLGKSDCAPLLRHTR